MCSKIRFFDAAVAMNCKLGQGAQMAKCDIKSAFQLLFVHQDFFFKKSTHIGFALQGAFHCAKTLPMDCSMSCVAFGCFSTFLEGCLLAG